jgi:hypothetical protein
LARESVDGLFLYVEFST